MSPMGSGGFGGKGVSHRHDDRLSEEEKKKRGEKGRNGKGTQR